jgi:hypothetical protein
VDAFNACRAHVPECSLYFRPNLRPPTRLSNDPLYPSILSDEHHYPSPASGSFARAGRCSKCCSSVDCPPVAVLVTTFGIVISTRFCCAGPSKSFPFGTYDRGTSHGFLAQITFTLRPPISPPRGFTAWAGRPFFEALRNAQEESGILILQPHPAASRLLRLHALHSHHSR